MKLMRKEPKKIKIREKKGLFGPVEEWEAEYVFVGEPERDVDDITDGISWAIRQDLNLPNEVNRHITHTHWWVTGIEEKTKGGESRWVDLVLEGDPAPWKFLEYHKKLALLRATIGMATLAFTYRHRDKDAFISFARDVDAENVTGRALTRVAKKRIHMFEGDLDEKKIAWFVKRRPEGNAYIIPPPEEIFEDEEKVNKLAEGIRHEFYKKYDIILPKEDIVHALKKSYEIAKKFIENYEDIVRERDPSEKIRKHPAYRELLQFLQEFAGAKRKVKRPEAVQGKEGNESGGSLTVDVLTMLQALKLLNYSEEAVNNAVKDLEKKIRKITESDYPTPEDVYRLGLYHLALSYIRERKFEKAEEVFRGL